MYNFIYSGFPTFEVKINTTNDGISGVEFLKKDTRLSSIADWQLARTITTQTG